MTKKRQMIVIVVVVVTAMVVCLGPVFGPPLLMGYQVSRAKTRLLCETDHRVLLEACRELSRRHANGEFDDHEPLASSPRLPEVIRVLHPKHVITSRDGHVRLELGFGLWPLGVSAYPEDYPNYPPPFKYGDRELLKGLWYYEDGYSLHPDAYDKIIDELLSKSHKLEKTAPGSDPNS